MTWTGLRIGQAWLTSSWGMSPSWHEGCWVWWRHSITVPTDPLGVVHPACDQCSAAAHLSLPPRPSSEPSDGFWWQLYLCAHVVPWQDQWCTALLKASIFWRLQCQYMPIFKCIHLEILSCRVFTPRKLSLQENSGVASAVKIPNSRDSLRSPRTPARSARCVICCNRQPPAAPGSGPSPGVPHVGPKQRTGDSLSRASAGFVVGLRLHVMTSASRYIQRILNIAEMVGIKWQEVFNGWYS